MGYEMEKQENLTVQVKSDLRCIMLAATHKNAKYTRVVKDVKVMASKTASINCYSVLSIPNFLSSLEAAIQMLPMSHLNIVPVHSLHT
jgi:hypothetical protein